MKEKQKKNIVKVRTKGFSSIIEEISSVIKLPKISKRDNFLYYVDFSFTSDELSKALDIPVNYIVNFFWEKGKKIVKNQRLSEEFFRQFCEEKGILTKQVSRAQYKLGRDRYRN